MRAKYLLIVCGLVAACDERPAAQRELETQKKAIDSAKGVSVDPEPRPDPSVDNRNMPALDPNARTIDLETERSKLANSIEARTEELDARIDALEKRVGVTAKDTVAMLRAKRDQARAKLSGLDTMASDHWEAYKRDVARTWDELEHDVDEALRL